MPATPSADRSLQQLIAFFAWTLGITFLICWGPLAILQIPGARAGGGGAGPGVLPFILGGFVPSFVGIGLTAYTEGRAGLKRLWRSLLNLRFSLRWYLAILGIALAVGGAQLLTEFATSGGLLISPTMEALLASPGAWVALTIQILFLGPLSEEFGWRGYAQERILARFSPVGGSLVLGVVWALWHLPLFFIPETSQSAAPQPTLQFLLFAVAVISQTVIMTWLYGRTGRSLGAMVLMHTAIGYAGTVVALLTTPGLLTTAVMAAGYLITASLVVWLAGPRLGVAPGMGAESAAA